MTKKHFGGIDELKKIVDNSGLTGKWKELADGHYQFVRNEGGSISWWKSTGTISIQGNANSKSAIESSVSELLDATDGEGANIAPVKSNQQIFIVHGHNEVQRDTLKLMLYEMNLDPFILQDEDGGGHTIIEALEERIGKDGTAAFGIVLMTEDDIGYAIKDGEEKKRSRARQNVILEMGMLLSSLTRKKVAILKQINVEQPSDASGIIYLSFTNSVKEVRSKLKRRMENAGIRIESGK